MMATTRLSVASFSQSMSLPSNGSMTMAMLGFFQGSLNSGDWARDTLEQQTRMMVTIVTALIIGVPVPSLFSSSPLQPLSPFQLRLAQLVSVRRSAYLSCCDQALLLDDRLQSSRAVDLLLREVLALPIVHAQLVHAKLKAGLRLLNANQESG